MAPFLSKITGTFFTSLINRLGVRPPPPDAFELSNVVTPVSLVDVDTTLPVSLVSPLLGTPFTAGVQIAPVAGAVLADTLAQVAGNYTCFIELAFVDPGGQSYCDVQRRNAANAANIWELEFYNATGYATNISRSFRVTLDTNERIRVVSGINFTAGFRVQASIWLSASA